MGKKGDLLRQEKKKKVVYTFTSEQLEAHNAVVRRDYNAQVIANARKETDKMLMEKENEIGARVLRLMFPIVTNIMVDKFHWTPAPKDGYDRRNRLTQLAEALVEAYEGFFNGEIPDIERYEKESYEKTGCTLTLVE